jgi:putative two-component system response regulator
MTERVRESSASPGAEIRQTLPLPVGAAALWNKAVEDLSASSTVLIADNAREDRSALTNALSGENYQIVQARDAVELFTLSRAREIDLVILDASFPDSLGSCQRFKQAARAQLTPVLMLLPDEDIASQIRALDSGADELVARPFHPDLLRTRVRSMLRHKNTLDQLEQSETILFALAQAIEKKDLGISDHCERLATFSVALGMSLGLPRQHLLALYRGGYLHDIGKVAIPDAILFKPGRLNAAEWDVMKTHTIKGEEICRSLRSLGAVLPIIRSHHERWDGSGYPDGLRGPAIPLLARILQMADVYDALTSARSYKEPLEPRAALAIMEAETGRGWRDPVLMKAFLELHDSAVLRAVETNSRRGGSLDGVRASLINLSRQLDDGRRSNASAYCCERVLEIREEISPIFDTYGDPD